MITCMQAVSKPWLRPPYRKKFWHAGCFFLSAQFTVFALTNNRKEMRQTIVQQLGRLSRARDGFCTEQLCGGTTGEYFTALQHQNAVDDF